MTLCALERITSFPVSERKICGGALRCVAAAAKHERLILEQRIVRVAVSRGVAVETGDATPDVARGLETEP